MLILPSLHRWRYVKETPRKPKYQTELPTNHLILFHEPNVYPEERRESQYIYPTRPQIVFELSFTGRNNNNFDIWRLPGIN